MFMVLTESKMLPLGSEAPGFNLMGIDGEMHVLSEYGHAKVLVVVFMCNHCPYVQKIWGDLVSLVATMPSEVRFVGINSNANSNYPEDSFEKMSQYAKEKGHNFPYLYDEHQEAAKAYGAVCTPDFFVYDAERKLSYRGNFEGIKTAVFDLLANKKPTESQKPSMGCSIKWN